jgi:hypothetical protein
LFPAKRFGGEATQQVAQPVIEAVAKPACRG